jgi:tetratricopeptide (TPR) repeat protein
MVSYPANLVEFPPALERVDNTIRLKFYDSEIYYEISSIPLLEQEGNHSAIIEIVTKALTHNLSPSLRASILASRGGILLDSEKISEAIADFEEACKLDSSNANAHVDYGYTLIKAGNYEEAVNILSKTIAIDSKLGTAYLNRGVALWKLQLLTESHLDLTTAIDLLSDYIKKAGAHLDRGQVSIDLGHYRDAVDDLGLAGSLYTDSLAKANCFTRQALALSSLGFLDKALEIYNKSIELNPVDFDALFGRALVYLKLGQTSKALADRDAAILLAPDSESKEKIVRIKEFQLLKKHSLSFFLFMLVSILLATYILIIFLNR